MRENRPSGLEGGARLNTSFLPLSIGHIDYPNFESRIINAGSDG
jgi:hypothetical protein